MTLSIPQGDLARTDGHDTKYVVRYLTDFEYAQLRPADATVVDMIASHHARRDAELGYCDMGGEC